MKKLKSVLAIIFSILAISILIYFLPLDGISNKIPFLNRFYNNTILEVISINGKAKVSIDGKEYGETPLTINDLNQGDYKVEIERIADTTDFYKKQTFTVKLTKNTTSRIEIEIGPAGILHGSILYYTPQPNLKKNTGTLSVLCDLEGAKVSLDEEYIKQVPIIAKELTSKEYNIEVSLNGYESLEIPILIEDGYLLNVKAFLFPIPVNFNTVNNE
jgi:hypothetical protein